MCDKAIEADPMNVALFNDRGLAKSNAVRYFEAISDFSQAIDLKKSSGNSGYLKSTCHNRAVAYSKYGGYDRAIEDFSRLLHRVSARISKFGYFGGALR